MSIVNKYFDATVLLVSVVWVTVIHSLDVGPDEHPYYIGKDQIKNTLL